MNEVNKRPMSIKRFLKGTPAKLTTEGFLHAHREWLRSHSFLSPILDAYEAQLILPTPTVAALQSALVDHLLLQEQRKHQARIAKAEEEDEAVSAAYTITLYVKVISREGVETVAALSEKWNANSFGEAMNTADRHLFRREDSLHAVIVNTQDRPIETKVFRGDAMARTLRQPRGAVQKGTGKVSSSLKWIGKAKQDRASFSHG